MLASVIAGQVYAAFGFAATFAVLASLRSLITSYDGFGNPLWAIVAFIFGIVHMIPLVFLGMLVSMTKTIALLLPVIIGSALLLKTSRRATMIYGAGVGLFVGWPVALLLYGKAAADAIMAPGIVSAGAMFALAVWQLCLKRYLPADRAAAPGRLALWWGSLGITARTGIVLLCLTLMAVSL
jgi:hypothetical protein